MNLSDMPARVAIPFGNSAGSGYIRTVPVPSQIGVLAGAASFTDGFTPDTFTSLSGGGAYVSGEDINGILNHVTRWTRWQTAGGPAVFNSAFATAAGGYPKGAVIMSTATAGKLWQSTVDGNLTDPDGSAPAGWTAVGAAASTLDQAKDGTDTATFLSPGILASLLTSVDGQSIRLPDGRIVKLGSTRLNGGSNNTGTALFFNTPFPNAFEGIVGCPSAGSRPDWAPITLMYPGFTVNGGTIEADSTQAGKILDGSQYVYWIAWGR